MIDRETAYKKAFEEKKANREKKIAERERKIAELCEKNPRITEINRLISAAGSKIAITALSGDKSALSTLKNEISVLSKEKEDIFKKANIPNLSFSCSLCEDTGYIKGKICSCIKEEAKKLSINSLSDELPLESCRFKNFNLEYYSDIDNGGENSKKRMTKIFKLAKEYALNFNPETSENLLFMGSAGLGKTHISLSIVYELMQKGFNVVYGSSHNLFSTMETEHFSLHESLSYNSAATCDLLVIDDLGSEFISPYIQSVLYNLINTRLLSHKPTIISTNLSMAEIEAKYTPRIASRLIGNYNAKKFVGKDIRHLKALERING